MDLATFLVQCLDAVQHGLLPALLFVTEFATVWVQDPFVLYRGYLWAIGIPGLVFFLFHGLLIWVETILMTVLMLMRQSDADCSESAQ